MFCLLPLAFDRHSELLSRASAAAILLWLANFKVCTTCLSQRLPDAAAWLHSASLLGSCEGA
jgi:hypothetical protein